MNALGTLRLLLRAARDGVPKFVHASTGSVFGDTSREHVEDGPKQPVSVYGISKLAGESYCRVVGETFGLDFTVLRYYHVIGPRQDASADGGVVPIFARRSLEGRPLTIYGSGAQTRSFTSVRDVVRGDFARRDLGPDAAGVLQLRLGHQRQHPGARRLRPRGDRQYEEIDYAPARPGDIQHFAVDNTKLRRLGVEFETDWRSIVREVIASLEPSAAATRLLT